MNAKINRLLAYLLSAVMIFTMLPATVSAAEAMSYIDESGSKQTLSDYTVISTETTTWTTGWYVAVGDVSIAQRVTVSDDVKLILTDGANLNVNGGISVSEGNSFTIYGQEKGTGALTATGGMWQAGIGGNDGNAGGTVTINGGVVTATGSDGGAGIGGGFDGDGGTVTINGGMITATGSTESYGKTNYYIGAGIGGGAYGDGGTVQINGGYVIAKGGTHYYDWDEITAPGIGGSVNAYSSDGGPGTFSTGETCNAVIIANRISDQSNVNNWKGLIITRTDGEGKIYGVDQFSLDRNVEIPSDYYLTISDGQTLIVSETVSLVNNGTITNNGTIERKGTFQTNGVLKGTGTITPLLDSSITNLNVQKTAYDGQAMNDSDVSYTYNGNGTPVVSWYSDNSGTIGTEIDAPTNPGTYWVKVSAAETAFYKAAEAEISFTIAHTHTWSAEWNADETYHWHECTVPDCTITENSGKDGYAEHVYNQENTDQSHLKADATCTTAATYYKSCVCGKNGTETFTVGEATGHVWGAWQSNGNNTHSRSCSNCTEKETENCTGGTATCQSKAVCTECGTEYGEKNLSNHTGTESWLQTGTTHQLVYSCCNTPISEAANHVWENGTCTVCQYPCKHTGGEATCTQKAICEICNSQYGETNPNNHKPSSEWTWENDKHYHICENGCGTHLDEQDCYGGTATCTDKALCDGCGHAYGDYGNHSMTEHPANEKTCTQDGNSLYWSCSVCGKYYSDTSGLTEIEENSWIIPAAHAFGAWTDEVPATCTREGTKGYKTCTVCGKYFDADGNEITDLTLPVNKDNHIHTENRPETPAGCETVGYTAGVYCTDCGAWVSGHEEIPATGHGETELKNAKEATCTAEGYTGDKVCTVCGEVVEQGKAIQKLAHSYKDGVCTACGAVEVGFQVSITAGANGTWRKGSEAGLSFTSSAAFAHFQKVLIDEQEIDRANYEVREGSTIVTLKASYLESLSTGKHTVSIVSDTGTAEASFTVAEKTGGNTGTDGGNKPDTNGGTTGSQNQGNTNSPQTGDSSNLALWFTLMGVGAAGLGGVLLLQKRRRSKEE